MLLSFGILTCVHCASSKDGQLTPIFGKVPLKLASCFVQEEVKIPGPPMSYAFVAQYCVRIDRTREVKPPDKFMEGVVGYVVAPRIVDYPGLAKDLARITKREVKRLYAKGKSTNSILFVDWSMKAAQSIAQGRISRMQAASCRVRLFGFNSVTILHPTIWFTHGIEADDFCSTACMVPPNIMYMMHNIRFSCPDTASMQERIKALTEYAQELCATAEETHCAPIATLNEEAFAFLVAHLLYNRLPQIPIKKEDASEKDTSSTSST